MDKYFIEEETIQRKDEMGSVLATTIAIIACCIDLSIIAFMAAVIIFIIF